MSRILALICFFGSFLFANIDKSDVSGEKLTEHIISSASNGREVVKENKLTPIEINHQNKTLYYAETILNWHYALQKENLRGQEVVAVTATNSLIKNVAEQKDKNETNSSTSNETIVVKGFCFISDEINVGKQPSSLRVNCETNVGGITLFANLKNLNEVSSLIVDPVYIEKKGYRFKVTKSVVTNENKTSYNVATYVNDRKIAEIGWGAVVVSSDEIKTQSNAYLKALEQSKQKQETEYFTTGNGANTTTQAVQNTNTQKPDPLDYLITSGINLATAIAKNTADVFKKDLPHLYQIVPNTKIWIDMEVEKNGIYTK